MIRRYDMRRSDNAPKVGIKSYACSGSGIVAIETGFPVTSAIITWSSIPFYGDYGEDYESMSSSSSLSTSSSSIDSSSSGSSISSSSYSSSSSSSTWIQSSSSSSLYSKSSFSSSTTESSFSTESSESSSSSGNSHSSSSSSSYDSSSSESSSSISSSSSTESSSLSSNPWLGNFNKPRIYIYQYLENGFSVKYENIPEEVGYIEFSYLAQ